MKIDANMNLQQLAERMGSDEIDRESVRTMRQLLADRFNGMDTADIPEREWLQMLDQSQQY